MDRFAANTLRTLGIILISVFVIGASLILLLLALCLGLLSGINGSRPVDQNGLFLLLGIAVLLIVGGILAIAKLSQGMVRGEPELPVAPYPLVPESAPASLSPPVPPASRPAPVSAARVVTHFSAASRAAISQLVFALCVKLGAELLSTVVAWVGFAQPLPRVPFSTFRYGPLAWAVGALAPLLVLIYALLRQPGPRAFAYSLVIPALQLLFGFLGHSATIFLLFRAVHNPRFSFGLVLLSFISWLLNILILYLAWKAVRLTGIHPSPTRLIVAAVVIFLYTGLQPVLVAILAYPLR